MEAVQLTDVLEFLRELDSRGGQMIDGDPLLESRAAEADLAARHGLIDIGSGWSVHTSLLARGREMLVINETWRPGGIVRMPSSHLQRLRAWFGKFSPAS